MALTLVDILARGNRWRELLVLAPHHLCAHDRAGPHLQRQQRRRADTGDATFVTPAR